jgi:predicted nucleic acid-binding protein
MNVVDSSGWIEYFIDTAQADNFAASIEQTALLIVPALSFFEVHRYLSRHTDSARRNECLEVMQRGMVIELNTTRAIAASEAAQIHRLAMADAIMYSIAREFNATFWTQDVDYQGLPGVNYFPRPLLNP